jgi:hypothetical protein
LIFPRDFAGACAGVQCSHCRDFEIAVAVSILGSLQRVLPPLLSWLAGKQLWNYRNYAIAVFAIAS